MKIKKSTDQNLFDRQEPGKVLFKQTPGKLFGKIVILLTFYLVGTLFIPGLPLVLAQEVCPDNTTDPKCTYSTFFGGRFAEVGLGIAVDVDGFVYVTGVTNSDDFPTADPNSVNDEAFVARFDPNGLDPQNCPDGLCWSTLIGGTGNDHGVEVALDASGKVYVAGWTSSTDFPTTDNTSVGNLFIVKMDDGNGTVVFSTIIGYGAGPGQPHSFDLAVNDGNIFIAGRTGDPGFFDPNIPLNSFNGGNTDVYAAKFSQTGNSANPLSLVFGTFVGGNDGEVAHGIAVDGTGRVFITGGTSSTDFPTTSNVPQGNLVGSNDSFIVILDSGGAIEYGTFLGGNEGEGVSSSEYGTDVAMDSSGRAYVTGRTSAADFPTFGAFDNSHDGQTDAFFTVLDPALSGMTGLIYSTYLGGNSSERGNSITVDASDNAYVFGRTWSNPFPTTPNTFDPTYGGKQDVFLTKFDPDQTGLLSLVSSTYFGGKGSELDGGLALTGNSGVVTVFLTGQTGSKNDFPITTPETYNGGQGDVFLSILEFSVAVSPTSMHVNNIFLTTVNAGQGKKRARAEVTIVDDQGNPVQGAVVTGAFTGSLNETRLATTDSAGIAVIDTVSTKKGSVSFGFCVDSVTNGLTYLPGNNLETCDTF